MMRHIKVYLLLPVLFLQLLTIAQSSKPLSRSTPEAEGVSSKNILQFLDSAAASAHEFHSIMVIRHGKVVAEGWWNPYRADLLHSLYSVSKSFTSTAIGFAVSEKKLTVNDKVISFFPELLPDSVSAYLAELKIKDLLSMSVGQETDPTGPVVTRDSNWTRSFLSLPIKEKPGSKFLYNSLATYMLSAIIQKVTGEKLIDYLRPRLFEPLGITGIDWETNPLGINTGGWGLRLKTEDMARFGQLYLQKGNWQGQQLLPAAWVEEASSLKIEQEPDARQSKKDSSDWLQGYCYQFWRSRHQSYRADGAYGQFILIFPSLDAVIVVTAETTASMQQELNLIWKHLLPAIKNEKLPRNKKAAKQLQKRLKGLALPIPPGNSGSPLSAGISGKTYAIAANAQKIETVQFEFKDQSCALFIKTSSANDTLLFDAGKWAYGETTRLGPSLVKEAKGHFAGLPPSKLAGSYRWKDEHTLELTLRYIDSPHTETITCDFSGEKMTATMQGSFEPKTAAKKISGSAK